MKKLYLFIAFSTLTGAYAFGQSAIDAYRFSQPDLKGTARFMSMGGAFGALGGDLSTLSQNPGGIGIYRSNEIGATIDLDLQRSTSQSMGLKTSDKQTKFYLNNIGGVATLRLNSNTLPNLNFGFTYNKGASFNRRFRGGIPRLSVSMSNYIAGIANNAGLTVADVSSSDNFDPYNPKDGGIAAPWLTILGYDGYLINPNGDPDNPHWTGQWGNAYSDGNVNYPATTGSGYFDVVEKGSIDEYNIAIGGNISNVLYWGMNFDITSLDYRLQSIWGENLENAWVYNNNTNRVEQTQSSWNMQNLYHASGTGFKYEIGFIVKPIQELRLGFAVHTPTWYSISESYSADILAQYYGDTFNPVTNNGRAGYNEMDFRSPWKFIVSAAGVIGSNFIISADYEWTATNHMKFSEASYDDYWDYDYGWDYYAQNGAPYYGDSFENTNKDIKDYYQATNTVRVGAEYRVTPNFSVRAGYSFSTSPVKSAARDNQMTIYTSGTAAEYRLDNNTNYITAGLGYKTGGFYVDLAYVHKNMSSEYHAFTPDPGSGVPAPQAKLSFSNNQLVLSAGYKF